MAIVLALDSPRWNDLTHAYGDASDIPELLAELSTLPPSIDDSEPWFSIWSALAHQGDVYDASFAAVPHVVHALASDPSRATDVYFQFPAWVEICRQEKGVHIPEDLLPAYTEAMKRLPSLIAAASSRQWDGTFLACAMSALAASQGFGAVAQAALELTPDVADEFKEWFFSR